MEEKKNMISITQDSNQEVGISLNWFGLILKKWASLPVKLKGETTIYEYRDLILPNDVTKLCRCVTDTSYPHPVSKDRHNFSNSVAKYMLLHVSNRAEILS